ncbi:MAG: hypothetical protein M1820_001391 [Bogoriella megaspora]|nr:MAG: hypothetical protein M1820_001391 [Bogoriella megaspora]
MTYTFSPDSLHFDKKALEDLQRRSGTPIQSPKISDVPAAVPAFHEQVADLKSVHLSVGGINSQEGQTLYMPDMSGDTRPTTLFPSFPASQESRVQPRTFNESGYSQIDRRYFSSSDRCCKILRIAAITFWCLLIAFLLAAILATNRFKFNDIKQWNPNSNATTNMSHTPSFSSGSSSMVPSSISTLTGFPDNGQDEPTSTPLRAISKISKPTSDWATTFESQASLRPSSALLPPPPSRSFSSSGSNAQQPGPTAGEDRLETSSPVTKSVE